MQHTPFLSSEARQAIQDEARAAAHAMPLEDIDLADGRLHANDTIWAYYERLRREAPVHYRREEGNRAGRAYWSVTRYQDIMDVDINHKVFSSEAEHGGIVVMHIPTRQLNRSFIAMDPPDHDEQRRAVSPVVAPENLRRLSGLIRERVCRILDDLPRNETFDWVERVSKELTTQMLVTLYDFPFEERHLLPFWTEVITAIPPIDDEPAWQKRDVEMERMWNYFTNLWNERVNAEPRNDLISMLAHSPATRNMTPSNFRGNIVLLTVGGNDTTRNSISGGLLFLNQNPDQYEKLIANPALISSMVPEIIRYQTPLAHMARTALQDIELGGQMIRKGDRVVMWYASGNRDDTAIENPDQFIIDRARPRNHLSFGFGVHRCVGNRLAEMQLTILWEEILKRFPRIEVVGEPVRVPSPFVHGYASMPVRIAA
ncbi:MAG: cytochrome P450 [Burkholderiaceae bacterium]